MAVVWSRSVEGVDWEELSALYLAVLTGGKHLYSGFVIMIPKDIRNLFNRVDSDSDTDGMESRPLALL